MRAVQSFFFVIGPSRYCFCGAFQTVVRVPVAVGGLSPDVGEDFFNN